MNQKNTAAASGLLLEVSGLDVDVDTGLDDVRVVKDLAFSIARGQTFALVGESGSGKSMTALALMRLLPAAAQLTGGTVRLAGEEISGVSEQAMRRVRGGRIGMIFQEPSTSLNPVMRVGDQIMETLQAHTRLRGAALRERAIRWLDRVGIAEAASRIDDYPFQFSGGQKQRIMIAIALAAEPALLIADEPTTALDVTVQAQILDLLADIQQELEMAVLLISHDLAVVQRVADHVAVMRHGEVLVSAPADVFFRQAGHPYVQQLFDAIPSYEKRGRPLSAHAAASWTAPQAVPTQVGVIGAGQALVTHQADQANQAGGLKADAVLALSVQNLSVSYPVGAGGWLRRRARKHVVDGLSFELQAGETLALLGESGCGKTTTGKALLRLLDAQAEVSGDVRLQGADVFRADRRTMRRLRRGIQIVFQDPYGSLDPRMRVGQAIEEGLSSLRPEWDKSERQRRIASLLRRVGLPEDAAMRWPHEFSGGQRQRIAIARALAVEPAVLVLDEPTSALDVSIQAQILDLLRELQAETGMAYLFITHNFSVVEYMADRIAVMESGKIAEIGPARQVLEQAQSHAAQRLLAAVPRLTLGESA
ncbi:ABC transporter ATP-binding protein [Kerstersia similis]|uniref:ABC transporter ATP-binding protein n=1 Tax=Kerstersia similis TaxID=206505 RepID=UPI0039F04622